MNIFLNEHKQVLALLLKHQVEFMLIGGYAVILYGYERGTADMDLWLKPSNDNKVKLITSFREHGISEESLQQLQALDFKGDVKVFSIGQKPNKIDFLTRAQGLQFDEAYDKMKLLAFKDFQVPLINYHHLITLKMIAGRPQDKADVDMLQKINRGKIDF